MVEAEAAAAEEPGRSRRVVKIVFVLFCLEIGLILLLLPWTLLWDNNYFFSLHAEWNRFWLSSYTRGGVSGLGLVNLWIAGAETLRMWR